ncbi:hypothetical protein [uncultured Tateyamaria sp.]|uniref:hypothetical protein n=1 Tax=uncultured Tateyamaria sp. TaxID=455651 RepID=UPI0026238C4B|nr:hypothetical protein [uncultured Tateyamaria sp.]
MRSLILTASLCLAAATASAGSNSDMTLSNGCVYAPSTAGHANAWSLKAATNGPAANCAFTVYTMPSFVAQARTSIISFAPTPTIALQPEYHVGVFR